ncbi:cyclic nucleotide-binding domain-containing protein [Geminocystis sp. CENA526]|uniref:cyclic nucleotide-binding domain-containing protein n=1 Tax=Geminocystis sp. CENA526 TaxID=1355871 RepID=UPI003D6E0754
MLEPSDVIDLFFNHLKTHDFCAGEVIFKEGEKGDKMFALMKGEVELWRNGKVIETIEEHDVFGEGALVQLTHDRVTTAIAKTDCKLAELNKERFLFLLQETPLFALEIVRSLSSRLRKLKEKMSI